MYPAIKRNKIMSGGTQSEGCISHTMIPQRVRRNKMKMTIFITFIEGSP